MLDELQARLIDLLFVQLPSFAEFCLSTSVFVRSNWRPHECQRDTACPCDAHTPTTPSNGGCTAWSRKRSAREA
ncbi:MAG: hypothetical protein KAY59_07015, partial [Acidobacteria bacterium]|nr:hypothetical protein [Acidobacteriota bacterium]